MGLLEIISIKADRPGAIQMFPVFYSDQAQDARHTEYTVTSQTHASQVKPEVSTGGLVETDVVEEYCSEDKQPC